jgi:glycosyltransferase involved in cell wall biosynthesis
MRFALDFASNWEIRGGVWRYGVELARALVAVVGPDRVLLPVYTRLPPARMDELVVSGATVNRSRWAQQYDRLDAMRRTNGRLIPWKSVLPIVYRPRQRQRLFRSGLGGAAVYHGMFTCRGQPRRGATVGTIHDLIPLLNAAQITIPTDALLANFADHRRWAQLVIVPSAATRSDLVQHIDFPADRLRVVHHGIDAQRFSPDAQPSRRVLDRYHLQSGCYFLYVGTLDRRKNIDRLIAAYFAAIGDRRDCPLVLAGAPVDEIAALKAALADGTERVRYIGYADDAELPDLYRHARALVHVALAEGFGFTPLEALSSGCPVIVSQHATTAEIVGDAGLLVDPTDTDSIAHGIRVMLDDPDRRADFMRRGPRHASQFTWERSARQTLAVYEEAHEIWRGTVASGATSR